MKKGICDLINNNKGITLVALVVTIIVLLILAGIAISLSIGNNGLFTRAQSAATKWDEASASEQAQMQNSEKVYDETLKKLGMNGNNSEIKIEGEADAKIENRNNIVITAKAVSENEDDDLTYTLYWGTTEEYDEQEKIILTAKSGEDVTFSKETLEYNTNYYWKIEVAKGEKIIKLSQNQIQTGKISKNECTVCNKKGYTTEKCNEPYKRKYASSVEEFNTTVYPCMYNNMSCGNPIKYRINYSIVGSNTCSACGKELRSGFNTYCATHLNIAQSLYNTTETINSHFYELDCPNCE